MQSATSFSDKTPNPWWNATLFLKNIRRFWPIWVSYGMIWLLALPASLLMGLLRQQGGMTAPDAAWYILSTASPLGLILTSLYSILTAMAVFSYLYQSRSVQFLHALPIRREGLFLTNYCAGLTFLLFPLAVIFFLCLGIGAFLHMPLAGAALQWLLSQISFVLFFYSFAVFCAMFTGHILALPVFYGVLNFLALGLDVLLNTFFRQFVFGYNRWTGLDLLSEWLSPVVGLYRQISPADAAGGGYYLSGLIPAMLCALAGLVFSGAALAVYRRRPLEAAGDIVALRWVRPVFQYGVAFCSAITLGQFLYSLFQNVLPSGVWPMLLFLLLGALVGYFAAQMLLLKTLRVFTRGWAGAIAICLVLTAACAVMDFDLIGFNRVPEADKVESITVSSLYTLPYDSASSASLLFQDEADIAGILEIHRQITQNRRKIETMLYENRDGFDNSFDSSDPDRDLYAQQSLSLYYTLKNGSVLQRIYQLPMRLSDLNDPGSIASRLTALCNNAPQAQDLYFGSLPENAVLMETSLDRVYEKETRQYTELTVADDQARAALFAAVKADLAAGRLGRRFLFDDRERNELCYLSDLTFTFYQLKGEKPAGGKEDAIWADSITVSLESTASSTLRCLRELGLLDENRVLITHAELSPDGSVPSSYLQ